MEVRKIWRGLGRRGAGLVCGSVALSSLFSATASAQMRAGALKRAASLPAAPQPFTGLQLSPDLLQTLGVGSRSIAMGGAYSAIADDASATYWNPGRLPAVLNREFMIEYRPVITANYRSSVRNVLNPTAANPNGITLNTGNGPGKPQIGFASITYQPGDIVIHRHSKKGDKKNDEDNNINIRNTIGLSYTVGGYLGLNFNDNRVTDIIADPTQPNQALGTTTIDRENRLTVRNSYITLAYGLQAPIPIRTAKGGSSKDDSNNIFVGVGAGIFFVDQEYRNDVGQTTTFRDATTGQLTTSTANESIRETGSGVGVNLGLFVKLPREFQFGLAYRTSVGLSGLSDGAGAAFNTEIPDRLTLGAAYYHDYFDHQNSLLGKLILSSEIQSYGDANRETIAGSGQIDARRAVTNFHFGAEYTPVVHRLFRRKVGDDIRFPLRIGFRTNEAAATNYAYNDNVISLGFAIQRLGSDKDSPNRVSGVAFSLDPALELLTRKKEVLYTITGILRF